jgi:hypothetical protein
LVVNPQTGKPLDEGTLEKAFSTRNPRMGSFMVANIFGMTPPAGTQPIKNESSRAMLSIFFAKTRMGWKETECLGSRVAAGENPSLRPQSNATTSRSWWVCAPATRMQLMAGPVAFETGILVRVFGEKGRQLSGFRGRAAR